MKEKPTYLLKKICSTTGGSEFSEVELNVSTETGEARLMIEYSVREYLPVTKYDDVMLMYEKLNGSGRKCLKIADILKAMWN